MSIIYLLFENLLFFAIATSFFVLVGWAWRHSKPFYLPEPLPEWFQIWFVTVQVIGILLPLGVMLVWGVWWGHTSVLTIFASYFLMLGLQIASEIFVNRQFHSIVWVTIPCLYLPYRIWQLYESLTILSSTTELTLVRYLLYTEIVLWIFNYGVHLSQLPKLMRWEIEVSRES